MIGRLIQKFKIRKFMAYALDKFSNADSEVIASASLMNEIVMDKKLSNKMPYTIGFLRAYFLYMQKTYEYKYYEEAYDKFIDTISYCVHIASFNTRSMLYELFLGFKNDSASKDPALDKYDIYTLLTGVI